jgi:hypothetical protein
MSNASRKAKRELAKRELAELAAQATLTPAAPEPPSEMCVTTSFAEDTDALEPPYTLNQILSGQVDLEEPSVIGPPAPQPPAAAANTVLAPSDLTYRGTSTWTDQRPNRQRRLT